jgi:uncharacterized protein
MSTLKFNVAQLLREPVGARRDYDFSEERLPIDAGLWLNHIAGNVRFTRTTTGVYAQVRAKGTVRLTCVRSLEEFDHQVELDFSDQFHSVIDVMTGASLDKPAEEDPYFLNELHMADVGEAIREYTLLALPINPVSPAYRDNPVNYSVQSEGLVETDEDQPVDARFEALRIWAEQQNKK